MVSVLDLEAMLAKRPVIPYHDEALGTGIHQPGFQDITSCTSFERNENRRDLARHPRHAKSISWVSKGGTMLVVHQQGGDMQRKTIHASIVNDRVQVGFWCMQSPAALRCKALFPIATSIRSTAKPVLRRDPGAVPKKPNTLNGAMVQGRRESSDGISTVIAILQPITEMVGAVHLGLT